MDQQSNYYGTTESPNPYDGMHRRASLSISYVNAPGGPPAHGNLASSEYARRSSVGHNGWVQVPLSSSPPPFTPRVDHQGLWAPNNAPQMVQAMPVPQQGAWVAVPPAPQPIPVQVVHVPVQSPVQERIHEVPVDKIVEKIVFVDRIQEVPVDRIVEVEKIVTKEVPVEVIKQVPVEKIVYKDRVVEVERFVEVPVDRFIDRVVERKVEVPVEVPVEKIVYVDRDIPSVGLGMLIGNEENETTLYVKEILPGYAAAASGQVRVGDEVLAIDGKRVPNVGAIKVMTVGPCGSVAQITLCRGNEPFTVPLVRCTPTWRRDGGGERDSLRGSPMNSNGHRSSMSPSRPHSSPSNQSYGRDGY